MTRALTTVRIHSTKVYEYHQFNSKCRTMIKATVVVRTMQLHRNIVMVSPAARQWKSKPDWEHLKQHLPQLHHFRTIPVNRPMDGKSFSNIHSISFQFIFYFVVHSHRCWYVNTSEPTGENSIIFSCNNEARTVKYSFSLQLFRARKLSVRNTWHCVLFHYNNYFVLSPGCLSKFIVT